MKDGDRNGYIIKKKREGEESTLFFKLAHPLALRSSQQRKWEKGRDRILIFYIIMGYLYSLILIKTITFEV
jgi:hypothetical protein